MTTAHFDSRSGGSALLQAMERATRAGLAAVDVSGRQIYVNPEFARMLGWAPDELLALRAPFPYWPPESRAEIEAAFQATVAGRAPADGFQLRFMRRDGERIDVRLLISPLQAEGAAIGWLAVVHDVSAERQAARERIDFELITALVDNSGEGIIVADAQGQIRIFSPEAQRQHGRAGAPLTADEWTDGFGLERLDGSPLPLAETPLYRALQGERLNDVSWRVRRPDGTLRVLEGTATPIRRADGELGGAMIITRDVTERADEARRLSNAFRREQAARADAERSLVLFESILAHAPVGLSFLDRELRYFRINERLARINGVPVAQTIGRLQRDVLPDVAPRMQAFQRRVFETGEPLIGIDVRAVTPASPEPRHFEASIYPIRDADGEVWLIGTVVRETTEERQQQAEQLALREQAARAEALRLSDQILRAVPDGIIVADLDGRITRWAGGAERIFGYREADAIGQRISFLTRADVRETAHAQVLDQIRRTGGFFGVLPCVRGDDGREIDVEVTATRFHDEAGHPVALVSVNRDVTDRLRAEREREALARERAERAQTEANERRFRTLAEATHEIVWRTDAVGRIHADSPSWRAFTGQSLDDWLDNRGWQALHPADVPKVEAAWSEAVRTRQRFVIEYRVRRRDGVYVPMSVRGAPVLDERGEVVEWIGANLDISARIEQQAERERLLESERTARAEAEAARLRMALLDRVTARLVGQTEGADQVVQTLADLLVERIAEWCAIYFPMPDGTIRVAAVTHRDPSMAVAARRHVERYPQRTDLEFGVPYVLRTGKSELSAAVTEAQLAAAATESEQLQELQAWNLGSYMVVPLVAHGRVIGAMALVRSLAEPPYEADDLALAEEIGVRAGLSYEQARLLREAQDARAQAEAASRARDDFLAMLGHELRNPLAPIVTALELMKLRGSPDSSRERAILERQVRHMSRLVDDLLDISRITRGVIELRRERVSLAELCARAIETTGPLFKPKHHHVRVDVPASLVVEGDPARLEQVLVNVLTNAAKHTRPEGQVTVEARRDGQEAQVRVIDSGPGIDPALLPHVFDLFTQGKQTIDRAQGGLGLGLTIVRRLVELHGGRVAIDSDRETGTTLTLTLPLATGDKTASCAETAPTSRGEPRLTERVLIVDDNVDAAELLADALGALGVEARTVHDGPAALASATTWKPEAVLLDIGLPGMDGYEVARRLHEAMGEHVPALIALTGYGQRADIDRTTAAGFAHHLVKPIDLDRLQVVLAQAKAAAG